MCPTWGKVKQFVFSLPFYKLFIVLLWNQNKSVVIHVVPSLSCKSTDIFFHVIAKLRIARIIYLFPNFKH